MSSKNTTCGAFFSIQRQELEKELLKPKNPG
jgi:hypothetical protein